MAGNKKGGRKKCEQEKTKAANGPSSTRELDDKVSKLNDLNQILLKEITVLREEKAVLSTNLTEIESTRKMTEEWKEVEKELRKELANKDAEFQAAISQMYRQLQEAEARLNAEISAKEEEYRTINLDKKNLEATVLQLKDRIQEISAELGATAKDAKCEKEVLLSQILAAKKETSQITRSNQIAEDAWNLEREKFFSRFAELETNLEFMSSEKVKLSEINRELRTEAESLKAQLVSEIESARKVNEEFKKAEKELRELGKKDEDYQVAISEARKQLQDAEERFNTEISAKEEECRAVKSRKLEKDVLLSQIEAAKKETAEITRISQMAQETWNAEKEKMQSRLAELETKLEFMDSEIGSLSETNRELKTEAESLKPQFVSEIESVRKMTEEWKEAEKELRIELAKKDEECQAAISEAVKQLQDAEERFNGETSMKEDERRRLNLDKKNLEATVLKLKNQIRVISSELETANEDRKLETEVFLSLEVARKETAEINRSYQMAQEECNAEKEILLSRLAELQAKLQSVASEKGSLSETNREKEVESSKAELVSEIESARKMTEEWKEAEKELRKELAKKDEECQAVISEAVKQLQEAEERFNTEISAKRFNTEISAKEEECRTLNLDKSNLEAAVLKLKNQIQVISSELETTNDDRKLEKEVFYSLEVARKETAEISTSYQMAQEDWNAEKEILLSRISELQTNLDLVASEKGLLSEMNRELKTEAECLKVQLDEYNDKLISMEDERQVLKAMSVSNAERLEALIQQNPAVEKEISSLRQQGGENVKQQSNAIEEYTVEQLSKRIVELQETHLNAVQKFETVLAESFREFEVKEEKHSELFRENEEMAKTINSLRGEINCLMNENNLVARNLTEATKKFEDSTVAEEGRSAFVDIANCIGVQEKSELSDVNEKAKAKDVNETNGVHENRKPKKSQTKTPNKSQRKRK